MRTLIAFNVTRDLQYKLYSDLKDYSASHAILGRLASVPVAILDVGLSAVRNPLVAIEFIAMAALNLIGVAFSSKFTIKEVLFLTENAFGYACSIPGALAMVPFKLVYQVIAGVIDPVNAKSISDFKLDKKSNILKTA